MADRRMFAKTIIDSDAFLDMPLSTQCLYFHLNMRADDDGFINNPKKIQRMIGASYDDLKLLIAKSFVIPFESGVVVIKHWKIHNWIRGDRKKDTVYPEEMARLIVKPNGAYSLKGIDKELLENPQMIAEENFESDICLTDDSHLSDTCQQDDSIGKDRIGKDSIGEVKEEESAPKEPPVVQIELIDGTMYDVTQDEIRYWYAMYPAVNVIQEMRNIAAWNHSNPKRRKTRSGIKRHVNTWLADKQNKSRTVYVETQATVPPNYDENPFKENA